MKKFFAIVSVAFCLIVMGYSICNAAVPKIRFHVTEVELRDGEAAISGELINETESRVIISMANIGLKATDKNGNTIVDEAAVFEKIDVPLNPNDVKQHTFIMENDGLTSYEDRFQWRVHAHLEWK